MTMSYDIPMIALPLSCNQKQRQKSGRVHVCECPASRPVSDSSTLVSAVSLFPDDDHAARCPNGLDVGSDPLYHQVQGRAMASASAYNSPIRHGIVSETGNSVT